MLEKTTRFIMLYDFYQELLTEKQKQYAELYFQDDLSLGEIAEEFEISRQAVYEHIKRSQILLEDYEEKLQLLAKHKQRINIISELEQFIKANEEKTSSAFMKICKNKITLLKRLE